MGPVDVLINNAGIVVGKYFHEHSTQEILKTMEINASGPMVIAHEFIQDMIARNTGTSVILPHQVAWSPIPRWPSMLRASGRLSGGRQPPLEMQQLKTNVKVTTIMPYYINTGMFDGSKSWIPILEPEPTALTIIKSIERDKAMVTIPDYIYKLTRVTQGALPVDLFDWVAGSVFGIYKTMEHFTGRKKE